MDIIFSHETALQICAQLKVHGNDEALSQRSSKDFRARHTPRVQMRRMKKNSDF